MPKILYNVPNMLSFYRIVCVPVLAGFFFIEKMVPGFGGIATFINCFLFFWACISDLADGMIARYTGQTSTFGKFIDHASDKILIGGVLMLLVAFDRLTDFWIIPALIIFLREILVAGLREFLGQYNVAVPVSWMGKSKTAVQMFAMGFLMAGNYGPSVVPHSLLTGYITFLIATAMTVISGWDYLKAGLQTLKKLEEEKTPEVSPS
jgi:cardiolipin synthase